MNFLTFESFWPSRDHVPGDPPDDSVADRGNTLATYWLGGLVLLLIGALVMGTVVADFFLGLFVASLGLIFVVAGIVAVNVPLGRDRTATVGTSGEGHPQD